MVRVVCSIRGRNVDRRCPWVNIVFYQIRFSESTVVVINRRLLAKRKRVFRELSLEAR